MVRLPNRALVGLPPRPFLYTPDQIAHIINVKLSTVLDRYLFYEGRSIGSRPRGQMVARNIAPTPEDTPVWRVGEQELIAWMQRKGFKFYERVTLYTDGEYPGTQPRKNVMPDIEADSPEEAIAPPDNEGVGSTDD